MTPIISVIIPTFRRTDSLRRLLEALLVQKEVALELIVVDQNPAGYLDGVLPSPSSIRHILQPVPNASSARNSGFLASSGPMVLFIDDDLIPAEDFCIRALDILHRHPEIGCFSPLVYNAEGKEAALRQAKAKFTGMLNGSDAIFGITDTLSAALFFRRGYFERTGGFDPALFEFARTAEDQELFLRMRKRDLTLYYVPSVEVYHDETIPGGCDLRTADYWVTREKCMKAWAYRHRIHHHPPGALSANDWIRLARSGVLNKEVLSSGWGNISRQAKLLSASIKSSGEFLQGQLYRYSDVEHTDHLTKKSA